MDGEHSDLKRLQLAELLANTLLFLSSLLLLIDITPRDFLPSQQRRVQAVAALHAEHNILGRLPTGVRIQQESAGMNVRNDDALFQVLSGLIRERAVITQRIDWARVVGVGYSVVSIPVANSQLEAFRPLYLTLIPPEGQDRMQLLAVGRLEDLDDWLSRQRQGSLTSWALVLLALGFLIQLYVPMRDVLAVGWQRLREH